MAGEARAQVELKDFNGLFSLEGKVVLVTGGSRGLGLHAASGYVLYCGKQKTIISINKLLLTFRFLQAGCSKVYITSRKAAACDQACAALNALPNKRPGAKAISVPADSAKIADVEMLVKKVKETTDHVDILFANAGATWGEKFDTHPDSAFAKVMDLNVKSVFNTIRLYVMTIFRAFLRLSSDSLEALAPFAVLDTHAYHLIGSPHFSRRTQH